MTVKSNMHKALDAIEQIRETFQPSAFEVIRDLAAVVDYDLTRAWPKRGDPSHPYATGESVAALQVKQMSRGISVRNRAAHWAFVGKSKNRRKTGLIYRAMPAIIAKHDQRITEALTEALNEALTPEEG